MRKRCFLLHLLVLLSTLIVLVACGTGPQQASDAGPPITTAVSSPQEDAWAQARASLPADVPVLRPNFVPDRFSSPTLLEVHVDKDNGPVYTINYSAPNENLAFILGMGKGALGNAAPPDTKDPITINNVQGLLMTTSASPTFWVTWQEQGKNYEIKVYSEKMTKEEVMRVVKSLTPVETAKL